MLCLWCSIFLFKTLALNPGCFNIYLLGDNMENKQDLPQRKTEKEARKQPKDYMTYMITVQTVICILLFAGLFVFSKIGGNSYSGFKDEIDRIMSYDMGVGGLKSTFKNAVDFVMAPSDQWKNIDDISTTKEKKSEDVTIVQQKSMGMGNSEISQISETGKAPTNSSFAPYTITAAITDPLPRGRISSGFGYRKDPVSGKYGFHSGIDIAADTGTNIVAAYSGIVKETGKNSMAGNYIVLEHGGGLVTFYCHCSEIVAMQGENIIAGQTIAKVGSTGYSTGPHLHFEIRINGVKYNPLKALME